MKTVYENPALSSLGKFRVLCKGKEIHEVIGPTFDSHDDAEKLVYDILRKTPHRVVEIVQVTDAYRGAVEIVKLLA